MLLSPLSYPTTNENFHKVRIGIVGHEAAKFTKIGEAQAKNIIRALLSPADSILVSGGCHLGGIDIWAEEIAGELGRPKIIHLPKRRVWTGGYKERNLLIARDSDVLHCLAVIRYANSYSSMKFDYCYHCGSDDHIKGGGCWTMKQARIKGKPTHLHRIENPE